MSFQSFRVLDRDDVVATTGNQNIARPDGTPEVCKIEIQNKGSSTVRVKFGAPAVAGTGRAIAPGEMYTTLEPIDADDLNVIADSGTAALAIGFWF